VAALRSLLPEEQIFYIGDTARVPYGGKSRETVERYSLEIGAVLAAGGAKLIVVACNTASALALPALSRTFDQPVCGVIQPGAEAAVAATRTGKIGILGTRATVASGAYEKAIRQLNPEVAIFSNPGPLLVPLIEEGLLDDPVTGEVITRYVEPLLGKGIDTLVLGCTHYPLLRKAIARVVGPDITLVDSASNCARFVKDILSSQGNAAAPSDCGGLRVALTDHVDHFLGVARQALDLPVDQIEVRQLQDL